MADAQAAYGRPRLNGMAVVKDARDWEKASDHVPVVVDFKA
jgi:endonuclease/exonuclease/phosphatase family metal-dependent hydrolase